MAGKGLVPTCSNKIKFDIKGNKSHLANKSADKLSTAI